MVAIPASLTPVSLESPVSLANQESQAVLVAPAALTPVSLESPVSLANQESQAVLAALTPVSLESPVSLANLESQAVLAIPATPANREMVASVTRIPAAKMKVFASPPSIRISPVLNAAPKIQPTRSV